MAPILGIMASQISGHLVTGAYDSIATTTVSTATASITFSSIPATYTHLQIRGIGRINQAADTAGAAIRLNSDTGSNYANHWVYGEGSTPAVLSQASTTMGRFPQMGGDNYTSSFGAAIIDILDYANTSKYKTIRSIGGADVNASGFVGFESSLWMNTAAVTTITLFSSSSLNWQQYSSFALYGIKGA